MIPNWPSLWEREPALRPEGLTHIAEAAEAAGYTARPAHYEHREADNNSWDDNDGSPGECSDELAAALCRDAAVWWIRQRDVEHIFRAVSGEHGTVAVIVHLAPSGETLRAVGSTSDLALFAMCVTIIDARDAAAQAGKVAG